jgi:peptidoglycan/LPS O-acetylase OafA/YrhL
VIGSLMIKVIASIVLAPALAHMDSWSIVKLVADAMLSLIGNIPLFITGYLVHDNSDKFIRICGSLKAVVISLVCWLGAASMRVWLAVSMAYNPTVRTIMDSFLLPIIAAGAFVVLSFSAKRLKPQYDLWWRAVHVFGLYSFGIYFLHPLILNFLRWCLFNVVGLETGQLFYCLLLFATTSIVTLEVVRLMARMPFGRYLG